MKKALLAVAVLILAMLAVSCKGDVPQTAESLPPDSPSSADASEPEAQTKIAPIVFPAYKLDNPKKFPYIDELNNTPPFSVTADFPKEWTLRTSHGDETMPTGEFYSHLFFYEGEKLIGYIGFDRFEPYSNEEEVPEGDYYKTVYPTLRLSSFFCWDPYTAVRTTDTGETGIAEVSYKDPKEIDNYPGALAAVPFFDTLGILSYDKELQVYIGIAFMPDTVDWAQAEAIAKSLRLTALE